jgi:hypothetical protein
LAAAHQHRVYVAGAAVAIQAGVVVEGLHEFIVRYSRTRSDAASRRAMGPPPARTTKSGPATVEESQIQVASACRTLVFTNFVAAGALAGPRPDLMSAVRRRLGSANFALWRTYFPRVRPYGDETPAVERS